MRFMKQIKKNKKGFTLVEIMISIAALGIVCAVLLRLFVVAGDTNDKAGDTQNAQLYASSTIETIVSADTVAQGMQALGLQFSQQESKYEHRIENMKAIIEIHDAGGDYPGTLYDIRVTVLGENQPLSDLSTKKYEQVNADD